MTSEDLEGFVKAHQSLVPSYQSKLNLYLGNHEILTQQEKGGNRPDNRIVGNLAHYNIETFNGFFMGIPPKITLDEQANNEALQLWNSINSVQDKLTEISKQSSIFGRSIAFLYQNEESETCIAYNSPLESFMIYSDSISRGPLYFIRYFYNEDNELEGQCYSATEINSFNSDYTLSSEGVNVYGEVPAVEFFDNEERQGLNDNVATIINAHNKALSQKANQVEYFDNAYLKVLGLALEENEDGTPKANIDGNQMIYSSDPDAKDAVVEFIEKPDGDTMQENLLDRLMNLNYQISMIANINDESFAGNSSGVSLEYKLLPMRNLAAVKERKFTQCLRKLYKIVFSVGVVTNSPDAWQQLNFKFYRNLPVNAADEAGTAQALNGIVSKETQLSVLSYVDDPKAEIERMRKEQNDEVDNAVKNSPSSYDFEKTSGDIDAEE
ncbi:phage portal protein [Listeria sp. ILCC792]|uniref:phage portal protein n=1 Tax=Listeria sp. ILCC792 TaxID=1918331 RepID=UPI001C6FCCD8|nr:phage portal protein [Listeria sp. ILCC792]